MSQTCAICRQSTSATIGLPVCHACADAAEQGRIADRLPSNPHVRRTKRRWQLLDQNMEIVSQHRTSRAAMQRMQREPSAMYARDPAGRVVGRGGDRGPVVGGKVVR